VLEWLSTRFCLVEKDKIRNTLRDAKLYRRSRSANCKEFEKITKVIVVLENIFPEIAKEVEE
jgi:hypothetical protein